MKIKHYLSLSALVLGLSLAACTSNKPAESKLAPELPDNFSEVTEFDEAIDVRTEDQKTFMEYDGDYAALTTTQF